MVTRPSHRFKPSGRAQVRARRPRSYLLSDRWKAAAVYGLVVAVIGTALVVRLIIGGKPDLDEALCPRGVPAPTHVMVLLDPTDPFAAAEALAIQRTLQPYIEAMKPGERLSVWAILPQEGGAATRPLFSRCRPQDGTTANPLGANPEKLRKRYHEAFVAPLAQVMAGLAALPGAKTSPILAAVREIAAAPAFAHAQRRVLVIVSDMLEHSPEGSHYRRPYNGVVRAPSTPLVGLHDALAGVEAVVLQRTSTSTRPYQTTAYQQFWQAVMHAAGVASYHVQPL